MIGQCDTDNPQATDGEKVTAETSSFPRTPRRGESRETKEDREEGQEHPRPRSNDPEEKGTAVDDAGGSRMPEESTIAEP